MFIIVDLPDPEVPTMAMNSPRSIRNETSTRAWTGSPVGRLYVLPIFRNSIMGYLPSLCFWFADDNLIAFLKAAGYLPVAVVPHSRGHPTPLGRAPVPRHDIGAPFLPAHGSKWQRQYTCVSREIDSDRCRHLRTQGVLRGRLKLHNCDVVDNVVANLRRRMDGVDVAFKSVIAIGVHGEVRVLPDPDSANVHFIYIGPNLQPREIEESHESWCGEVCGHRLALL